jgi:hypothetical protein
MAFDAYVHLVDTLRKADVQGKAYSLGAVVDENGTD